MEFMEFTYSEQVELSPLEQMAVDPSDLDEDGCVTREYLVGCSISGRFSPQTYWEPAEYPELSIEEVVDERGKKMPAGWVDDRYTSIESLAWSEYNEGRCP